MVLIPGILYFCPQVVSTRSFGAFELMRTLCPISYEETYTRPWPKHCVAGEMAIPEGLVSVP